MLGGAIVYASRRKRRSDAVVGMSMGGMPSSLRQPLAAGYFRSDARPAMPPVIAPLSPTKFCNRCGKPLTEGDAQPCARCVAGVEPYVPVVLASPLDDDRSGAEAPSLEPLQVAAAPAAA